MKISSVPRGRVPQDRVRAPLAPHAPGTGSLLGVRFPTHPFWGVLGRRKGVRFPNVGV